MNCPKGKRGWPGPCTSLFSLLSRISVRAKRVHAGGCNLEKMLVFFRNTFTNPLKVQKGVLSQHSLSAFSFGTSRLLFAAHLSKTVAAIDGAVALRLKGDAGFPAAVGAGGGKELSGATGRVLAGVTAGLAALRLVLETALCLKLLLASGEHELVATFLAYKCLVFKHDLEPSLFCVVLVSMGTILRSGLPDSAGEKGWRRRGQLTWRACGGCAGRRCPRTWPADPPDLRSPHRRGR